MQISAPCVVALSWRLEDTLGNLIDEAVEPVELLHGGVDLLGVIEAALEGRQAGDRARIQIEPENAFGEYDAGLAFFEQRSLFPPEVEPGMQFETLPEGCTTTGLPAQTICTVTEVYPEHVVLDGNHPLAGIALRLQFEVHGVRAATPEEIERGSVGDSGLSVLAAAPPGAQRH